MSKKSFAGNPALAYMSGAQEAAQQHAQEGAQEGTQDDAQGARRPYTRTQGRKGHKKPRINLAFDSEEFLDEIRVRAGRDGMSVTQLVNEAVARYLDMPGRQNERT